MDGPSLGAWCLQAAAPAGGAGAQLRVAAAAVLLQDLLQREAATATGWAFQAGSRAERGGAGRQADDGTAMPGSTCSKERCSNWLPVSLGSIRRAPGGEQKPR